MSLIFSRYFSQSRVTIGAWQFDPYLSFTLSTLVELLAYVAVHLTLNRFGRKNPYCISAVVFGLVALTVIPVQSFLSEHRAG